MDPLSISVSILAIIGAISTTIKTGKSVYRAPEELESLINDLTEGEIMVVDIKYYLGELTQGLTETSGSREELLQRRLIAAESILLELKTLVQERLLRNPDKPASIRRYAWFKTKRKVRKLRDKLSEIHTDLPRRLGHVQDSRIQLELKNISLVQSEVITGLSRIENIGKEFRDSALDRLVRLESTFSGTRSLQSTETSKLPTPLSQQSSLSLQEINPIIGNPSLETSPDIEAAVVRSAYRSVQIRTQYRQPSSCDSTCKCRCHSKQNIITPSFLVGLIGQMFIGYKGIPSVSKACTETRCKRIAAPDLHVLYYFPEWFVSSRVLLLTATQRVNLGPELVLRFSRRIPPNTATSIFIGRGSTEDLKELFASAEASPNDIIILGNMATPLLHYAVRFEQFETLKFLTQAGADVNIEDNDGRTIFYFICRELFSGRVPQEHQQYVIETFMSCNVLDFRFSGLHEVVLGLRFTSIEQEARQLLLTTSTIDIKDSYGCTPLHWACERGDKNAIILLLKYGADPNILNDIKCSPLYRTIRAEYVECAIALLEHGADACAIMPMGWSAMHVAIRYCGSHASTIDLLEILFQRGVDIDGELWNGVTNIFLSIEENAHVPLLWLLKHNANYRKSLHGTLPGMTILHYAGYFADVKTIQILREAQLSDIDIHAKLKSPDNNVTALEQLMEPLRHEAASEELIAIFKQLLSEIEVRTNGKEMPVEALNSLITESRNISPSLDKTMQLASPKKEHLDSFPDNYETYDEESEDADDSCQFFDAME